MVSEGIFINGEKVTFNPENILNGDVSAYTEAIGEATQDWLDEHLEPGGSVPIDDTLTIAGAAADAKKTGDEISELKSGLGNLKEELNHGYYAVTNIVNGNFNADGTLTVRRDRLRPENYIPVKIGDKIVIHNGSLKHACGAWNGTPSTATNVRNDLVWNTADETIVSEIDGYYIVAFAKLDSTQDLLPSDFDGYIRVYSSEIYRNSASIEQLEDDIESAQDTIDHAVTVVNVPVYEDITTAVTTESGYYGANGSFFDNSDYKHSQKISVMEGDVITPVSTVSTAYFRFICAYNGTSTVSSAGASSGRTSYTVPNGIDGVILSWGNSQQITGVSIKRITGEEKKFYPVAQKLGNFNWKGDLSDGDSVELLASNVRFNVVWCFTGHISTTGKITIGIKATDGTIKELCSVDSTYIYYRLNNGNIASEAHGLAISEDLQIKIDSPFKVNELGSITICSDGTEYTLSATAFGTDMTGYPYLVSDGVVMTDCAFSWIPKDIDKPIWVFGDSWVSMYDTRWVYYMVRDEHVNSWMLNGFAGEDTDEALDSFKNLLTIRKPEYLVWLLGMNNGDSSSAVNSVWKSVYDELVQICTDYDIELILYTVPNTPTINNNYKNAIVRNSGYRYIDGVSAVGDDGNGNWFTGFEQSALDHNHTSAKGAKALYYRIIADFPEIAGNSL